MPTFVKRSEMPVPRERLFEYHARPGALQRLLPPFQPGAVLEPGGIRDGERVVLRAGPPVVGRRWVAVHRDYVEGHRFTDDQASGPFARWTHVHGCLDLEGAPGRSVLEDRIDYALPGGRLGQALVGRFADGQLARMFRFRHERTYNDLSQIARHGVKPQRVAITGATGLVGRSLEGFLSVAGHEVVRIVRRPRSGSADVGWDPSAGRLAPAALEGIDTVVHLAGESIAGLRWTDAKKRAIRSSRVDGTRLLAETIAGLAAPPSLLISASAVGFYGHSAGRSDARSSAAGAACDEKSPAGRGFLADVCREWEAATEVVDPASTRVVKLRIGVVLSAEGGALATQRPLFELGLGGRLGLGRQGFSWIGLDDLVYSIHFLLGRPEISGPVNATAPGCVSNAAFTRSFARVLRRPAVLPVPAFVLRAALGEMADEMMLGGAFVLPTVLESAGFRFVHPDLHSALAFALGRAPGGLGP